MQFEHRNYHSNFIWMVFSLSKEIVGLKINFSLEQKKRKNSKSAQSKEQ